MKAYTVSELTSAGWTKVTSISDVDNNYYVFVDAGSSDYVMGRLSYGTERPVYQSLVDPFGFNGVVWYLGASDDNYTIRSIEDDHFFISGTEGWNDQIADQQWGNEGLFKFTATLPEGKFSIQSVKTSSYVGPWNNDNVVSLTSGYENVAANKAANQAPGFYLYSIPRAVYNANRITASWLTSHGWSQVTANSELGNTDNYYLIIEKETFGYAMARTSNGRPASKSLSNPFATTNELWLIATKGSGYSLQNVVDGTYFTSAAGDWNTSMSNSPNADIIATVDGGVYTLSAGGTSSIGHWRDDKFFPYENESVAANKSDANRNNYYIYTISKAEYASQRAAYIASLASSATAAAPTELTSYIFNNADFANLGNLGWTRSGTAGNQQTGNGAYETWTSNNVSITQELTNLPGGKYILTVQMVSGDAGRVPYLYANADEEYTANVTQQATDATYGGMKNEIAADPNYGLLTVNPISSNGSLTVGMKAPSGWVVFDNFKLYYQGPTISSSAVALPASGDMAANQWYYIDIATAADNYNATATTLGDIVYTTDGTILVENQATVTANFAATDNSLSATRYYVKSSSNNNLEIAAASYTYVVGDATISVADGSYISTLSTITFTYADATTNDPDASFELLNGSAKAVLTKGGVNIAEGTLSLSGNVLTATFSDVELELSSTYDIAIAAGVVGYEGHETNAAINTSFNTGVIADGEVYYLKKKDADIYITRGGWYGTEAVVGNFGLSFQAALQSDGTYTLKNVDHSLSANAAKYLRYNTSTYTDQAAFGWIIEATEGGYYLRPSSTEYMATTAQGEYPYSYLSATANSAEAYVWNLLSKSEYAAALTSAKNSQASAIATAADITASTVAELESVLASDYGTTDMTSSITNAASTANMDGWTQVKYNGVTYKDADANGVTAEIYNSTGGVKQDITSLPAGIYKVTVYGTWRPGNSTAATRVGAEANTTAWIYANTATETNIAQLKGWYDGGGTINSRADLVSNKENYLNTVYVYVAEGQTLTIGLASPSFCEQPWCPFFGWTLTRYEAKATPAEKAALVDAIEAAEAKTLGFEDGEYAPYENTDALTKLAAAKAINPETASGEAVVNATTALTGATWTPNAEEVNAFYGGDFTQYETISGEDMPYGWNLYNGATNHSRIMGGTEGSSNAGLAATTSGKALLLKFNATYGESEGYTMPLKGGKLYKITFKHGRWAEANPRKTNVIMTDPNGTSITLAPGFQAKNNDCQSNVGNWEEFTGYFVATIDGNYKFNFEKELKSGQNTQMQIAIGDIELKSSTDALVFADDAAVPTYAPGTYPSVKITRTLTANKWATAVYPFAVSGVDDIAVLDSYNSETGEIHFTTAAASTANEPFLMRSTAGTTEISLSDVTVAATVAEPEVTKSVASLKGVYASDNVPVSDEENVRYVVSNNQLYKVDGAVSIKPFRAYFELTGANAEARPTLRFDDVTAINAIEAEETEAGALKDGKYIIDNKVVIVKNGVKYGANGQKLN